MIVEYNIVKYCYQRAKNFHLLYGMLNVDAFGFSQTYCLLQSLHVTVGFFLQGNALQPHCSPDDILDSAVLQNSFVVLSVSDCHL